MVVHHDEVSRIKYGRQQGCHSHSHPSEALLEERTEHDIRSLDGERTVDDSTLSMQLWWLKFGQHQYLKTSLVRDGHQIPIA